MNREDTPSRDRQDDARLIARLLPAPATADLPPQRHLHHKERLMDRIDRDHDHDREQAVSAAATSRPAPRPRLLRPALLVPVTALALAGALTAGIALTTTGEHDPDTAAPPAPTTDTVRPASALLRQISDVALKNDVLTVRDDQFLYTRSKFRGADLTSGKAVVGPLTERETWSAQDRRPLRKLGLIRSDGETFPLNAELGDTEGTPPGLNRPTYRWLAALPTDPDRLLTYLYAHTPKVPGQERAQTVFDQIGSLLGGVMPPRTASALYQAAATIPGVTEAPSAHDAIDRRGVGIARDDTRYGTRTEWVFDAGDFTFLGSRSYLTKDGVWGKSGTLLSSSAELTSGVVDKAGSRPAGEPEGSTRES